ncbi:MAG: nuclear transport factor 2 family protein [Myxococcota bacterium]
MDQHELHQAIQSFYQAADNHDMATLDSMLHRDFRLVVTRPDMGPQVVDKKEYMALMMTNIIGGKPRQIQEIQAQVSGDRGVGQIRLEGPFADFHATQTYVRDGTQWRLLHSATEYRPRS